MRAGRSSRMIVVILLVCQALCAGWGQPADVDPQPKHVVKISVDLV